MSRRGFADAPLMMAVNPKIEHELGLIRGDQGVLLDWRLDNGL